MGSLSIWHWLIVLIIILLIFGTKKLRNLGSDLGGRGEGLQGWHAGRDRRGQAGRGRHAAGAARAGQRRTNDRRRGQGENQELGAAPVKWRHQPLVSDSVFRQQPTPGLPFPPSLIQTVANV